MKILSLIIKRWVRLSDAFCYHHHCKELGIINVCFADDLFIFVRGEVKFAKVIMDSLEEFKQISGLVSSLPKSTTYFCNVRNHVKLAILNIMHFSEGKLPVKYLGVLIISSRLLNKDCKILVEKAKNRIGDWKNKSLSFAGRLQLCKSVISFMHVYWASVLVIPKGIIHNIQQLIRGFLWCNGEFKRGKAKVVWETICLPKREGGLGILSLETFNLALITNHIWNIIINKESLWMRWIHIFLTPRDITLEGFNLQNKVVDFISNGVWSWPQSWLLKAPNLEQIMVPTLDTSRLDLPQWHDLNGKMSNFVVSCAWEALRPCGVKVPWYRVVWYSHCIPQHTFHLWLVMRQSLKTQDRLRQWDVGIPTNLNLLRCAFFHSQPDTHDHIFFEYSYSSQVWNLVRPLAGMDLVQPRIHDIRMYLQPIVHRCTTKSVIGRLILVTTAYFLWFERNNRLFKNTRRKPEVLRDIIMVTVRLKMITFRFKNTSSVTQLLSRWKLPTSFRLYDH
ncbi:homeodomain-like protein [Tanacetum coccineum]